MTNPVLLDIEIQCPVCVSTVFYPEQPACDQCGWPVIVYGTKPGKERIDRFRAAKEYSVTDHTARQEIKSLLDPLKLKASQMASAYQQLLERSEKLETELQNLLRKKQGLLEDPIFSYNPQEQEQEIAAMRVTKAALEELMGKVKPKTPGTTLRCIYDKDLNHIKAEVAQITYAGASDSIELFLGLAVSSSQFDHYKTAEMVIPVKDRDKPVKIEHGKTFFLELAQRPEKTAVYHQIVHLYPMTIPKFKII